MINKTETIFRCLCLYTANPMSVGAPVLGSAGAVGVLWVLFLVLRRRRRQNNNDIERGPLLGNGAVDQVHNPIGADLAGRSLPVSIGSSRSKADVNLRSAHF